jgi:hypothetical protein
MVVVFEKVFFDKQYNEIKTIANETTVRLEIQDPALQKRAQEI